MHVQTLEKLKLAFLKKITHNVPPWDMRRKITINELQKSVKKFKVLIFPAAYIAQLFGL